jgi:hypothetical protein
MATSTRRQVLTDSYPVNLSDILTDQYPFVTSVRYPLHWLPCHFQVLGVRDLAIRPLTVEQYQSRPMLRRSRYQLRVLDLRTGNERTIYHRLLRSHFRDCPLRVGIYDGPELQEVLRTNWGPTIADRQRLLNFLDRFSPDDLSRLGIFSDDCEVVTAFQ